MIFVAGQSLKVFYKNAPTRAAGASKIRVDPFHPRPLRCYCVALVCRFSLPQQSSFHLWRQILPIIPKYFPHKLGLFSKIQQQSYFNWTSL